MRICLLVYFRICLRIYFRANLRVNLRINLRINSRIDLRICFRVCSRIYLRVYLRIYFRILLLKLNSCMFCLQVNFHVPPVVSQPECPPHVNVNEVGQTEWRGHGDRCCFRQHRGLVVKDGWPQLASARSQRP